MTCKEAIEQNLCLGCNLAEININADNCKYRDKAGIENCKEIIEQIKMEGLDE